MTSCDRRLAQQHAAGAGDGRGRSRVPSATIVLLTPEEVDAAMKLTLSYRAPGRSDDSGRAAL
jgi:hypothetical protein